MVTRHYEKRYEEDYAKHRERLKEEGPRKPLRTLVEMAEEFGISSGALSGFLGQYDGPKARITRRSGRRPARWYDPDDMRKWWELAKVFALEGKG